MEFGPTHSFLLPNVTSAPTLQGIPIILFTSLPTTHKPRMPSKLVRQYTQTVPMYYERLRNSVIGSAEACSRISDELLETRMQRQIACMHPAFSLLQTEFLAMHYILKKFQYIVETLMWHDYATTTVECVQQVCQQVANETRDMIRASQIWNVVAFDHINDRLHASVVTLQEQQMTLELLIVVMAFFDFRIDIPSVTHQYKIHH